MKRAHFDFRPFSYYNLFFAISFITCLQYIQVINMNPLSCSSEDAWEHGNSLINYMKMVEIDGLTGRIKFDQDGQRSDFQLEIVELKKHGLDKVLFFQ